MELAEVEPALESSHKEKRDRMATHREPLPSVTRPARERSDCSSLLGFAAAEDGAYGEGIRKPDCRRLEVACRYIYFR
jgi:hypothetical protein